MNIDRDLNSTISTLKSILVDNDDIVYRMIDCGEDKKVKMCIVYVDGMTNKEDVMNFAIENLMDYLKLDEFEKNSGKELDRIIAQRRVAISEIAAIPDIEQGIDKILSGETMLYIDGCSKAIMLSSRGWPMRGVSEPTAETVIRGPQDGFNETLKVNIALIRRRIRDPKLKVKYMQIGTKSKTDIALFYLEDKVNRKVLEELKRRLKKIDIEAILESSYIEEMIEDNTYSPFPQVENTQRPDAAASAILEGRL